MLQQLRFENRDRRSSGRTHACGGERPVASALNYASWSRYRAEVSACVQPMRLPPRQDDVSAVRGFTPRRADAGQSNAGHVRWYPRVPERPIACAVVNGFPGPHAVFYQLPQTGCSRVGSIREEHSREARMRKHQLSALVILVLVTVSALGVIPPRSITGAAVVEQTQTAAKLERKPQGSLPAHELAGAVVAVALVR
jgi:hypothetical protein